MELMEVKIKTKNTVKSEMVYIFLLIPFFKPVGLATISTYNSVMQIWKLISVGMIVWWYFLKDWKITIYTKNSGILGFVLFGIIYILNCMRFGNDYSDILNNYVTNLVLLFFIIVISKKYNKQIKNFLNAIKNLFVFWIVVHTISLFLVRMEIMHFSDGGSDYCYIFGTDNYSAFAIIPMLIVVCYIIRLNNNKRKAFIKNALMCAIVAAGYICVHSISAALAALVMLIFQLFSGNWEHILKKITVKRTMLILVLLLFLILHYNIQNYFLAFIAETLGKGEKASTLNSRTIIWKFSIDLIKNKPLLGYGAFSQAAIDDFILYGIDHTHNLLLELLVRTGLIGTVSYIWFLIKPVSKKYKKLIKSKANVLVCGINVFLILSFMDVYPLMQYQYVLFAFLYCWGNIEKVYETEEYRERYDDRNRYSCIKLQEL